MNTSVKIDNNIFIKKCSSCKETKNTSEFYKIKSSKDGFQYSCKLCGSISKIKSKRTKNGLVQDIYFHQKRNSKRRGHKPPNYTFIELREWIFSQPHFRELYNNWVNSDYDRWFRPSCDRLEDELKYTFENLRLVTWKENDSALKFKIINGLHITKRLTAVVQYNLDKSILREYSSIMRASRKTNIGRTNIGNCVNGLSKTAGGFVWEFKKINNESKVGTNR